MTDLPALRRWRMITLVCLGLLGISVTLLVWASTSSKRIEPYTLTWQGVVDVVTAFAIVMLAMTLRVKANKPAGPSTLQISYNVATALTVVILIALWLFAGRIRGWDVLLPGLAWRTWVVLQTLPTAIALWRPQERSLENAEAGSIHGPSNGE